MKTIILMAVMALAIAFMPTTTQPITVGDAAYRIAAGVGGILTAKASLGFALGSIALTAYASAASCIGVVTGEPIAGLFIAVPLAGLSVASGFLSYGCGYLSYRCFCTAFAPEVIHNNTVHIIHHYHDKQDDSVQNAAQPPAQLYV